MSNFLTRARGAAARLRTDRRGNILMIFAFALLPITFATGMGVDYAGAMRIQTKVNAVADAAALSGVNKQLMSWPQATACYAARMLFTGQSPTTGLTLDSTKASDLTIVVTDTPLNGSADQVLTCPVNPQPDFGTAVSIKKRTMTVTWNGTSKNSFSGVLGMSTLPIHGTATAQASLLPYIDVHMVLDTSQSMGLAASDADAAALYNKTAQMNGSGRSCVFGCHVFAGADGGNNPSQLANEQIAANNGIKLRINVLRDATADMIQTAINNQGSNNTYRFGLYRVGANLTTITALTTNLSAARTTASTLTLGPNNAGGDGDTDLGVAMTNMYGNIPLDASGKAGDGSTQAKSREFMFLVTDGVSDVNRSCRGYGNHCTRPIDPATCQRYKDAGITVGIVYTTYLPVKAYPLIPGNTQLRPEYTSLVQSFNWPGYISPNPSDNSADIAPALQACASSGWYFEASDGTTIHAAMQKLFAQASQSATLTH